jgi:glycolate oxidase FAD binding subunit
VAPNLTALERRLRDALPAVASGGDPADFAVDGLTPPLIVAPSTPEEVAGVLVAANDAGAAVIPRGAGTGMHIGMPPARYDLALDLSGLQRTIEYEPADLTVTVEAGLDLAQLQDRLVQNGQWLPIDPPDGHRGETVGGVLATDAQGAVRIRYGTARDRVIGITVALADGSLVKSGGRVVKNVAGYDLAKLHIGALGTLGVIVQASFKLVPLPQVRHHLLHEGNLGDVMKVAYRVADAGLALEALELQLRDDTWLLRIVLAGGEAAVHRSERDVASIVAATGIGPSDGDPRVRLSTGPPGLDRGDAGACVLVRAGVLPSTTSTAIEALAAAGAHVTAYPTAGVVYGSWAGAAAVSPETIASLRRLCIEQGKGALVVEAAPPDFKRRVDVWGPPGADFAIMRRLKSELDPKGILNPGRYLGGI